MAKKSSKRLYKAEDGMICGVCKGIAEYFDIDPTIVRLAWAAMIFVLGTGILLYFVCAIIFPPKSEVVKPKEAKIKDIK